MASGRIPIDVHRAIDLRAGGLSWGDVGRVLAKDEGREVGYQGESVLVAVARWRKRKLNLCPGSADFF